MYIEAFLIAVLFRANRYYIQHYNILEGRKEKNQLFKNSQPDMPVSIVYKRYIFS